MSSALVPAPHGHTLVYSEPGYTVSQDSAHNVYLNGLFVQPLRGRMWRLAARMLVRQFKRAGVVFVRV